MNRQPTEDTPFPTRLHVESYEVVQCGVLSSISDSELDNYDEQFGRQSVEERSDQGTRASAEMSENTQSQSQHKISVQNLSASEPAASEHHNPIQYRLKIHPADKVNMWN